MIRTLDALGGTVLPDELRGDRRLAERVAAGGDGWDGELARALVSIRYGRPNAALSELDRLFEALTGEGRAVAAALRAYASVLAWQALAGGHLLSPEQPDVAERRAFVRDARVLNNAALRGQLSEDSPFLPQYLLIAGPLQLLRDFDASLVAGGLTYAMARERAAALGDDEDPVTLVRQRLARDAPLGTASEPAIRHHLRMADAQMRFRSGDPRAWDLLHEARTRAVAGGDTIGAVGALLREASWRLAPLGRAEYLDMGIGDSGPMALHTLTTASPFELTKAADSDARAVELLDEAERLLAGAAERARGTCPATIALHRSWLAFRTGDHVAQSAAASAALTAFDRAGDEYGRHLAQAHTVIAAIGAGAARVGEAEADEIGAWAAGGGSYAFGLGLGLLLTRLGQHWQLRRDDLYRARQAFGWAHALFTRMDARQHRDRVAADLVAVDRTVRVAPEAPGLAGAVAAAQDSFVAGRRSLGTGDVAAARAAFTRALDVLGDPVTYQERLLELTLLHALRRFPELVERTRAFVRVPIDDWDPLPPAPQLTPGDQERVRAPMRRRLRIEAVIALQAAGLFDDAAAHLDGLQTAYGPDWWREEDEPWTARALCARIEARRTGGRQHDARRRYAEAFDAWERGRGRAVDDVERTSIADDPGTGGIFRDAAFDAVHDPGDPGHAPGDAAFDAGDDPGDGPGDGAAHGTAGRRERALRAFDVLERGRGRALLDLRRSSRRLADAPAGLAALVREWRAARSRWAASTGGRQDAAAEACAAVERRLQAAWPGFAAQSHPFAALRPVAELQRSIPEDTVLLTYCSAGDELLVLAARGGPDGPVDYACPPVGWDEVAGLLARWNGDDPATDRTAGARLSELLLAPFAGLLDGAGHLLLVPDGAGLQAPLHVLPWRGAPLIDTFAVTYLPAVNLLADEPGPDGTGPALVVGNPAGMAHGAQPLRFAELEAGAVAARLGVVPLIGAAPTRAAVLAGLAAAPIIHLATHTMLDGDDPARSVILLAGGEELTVEELIGTGLRAGLAVLSSCHSGVGRRTAGNEVLGLARTLLGAGVGTVVGALWAADDLATSVLMRRFYERLAGSGPAAALALAQREIRHLDRAALLSAWAAPDAGQQPGSAIRDLAMPHHHYEPGSARIWAPFIVMGRPPAR
ncbi:CHAT domain-containing protein [Dactylosporangium sp. NBC_01737]|uniref:CHAT domain-containing protein n=1 Tax=Dactylosporangium sp. NBC_01737 TaxID=2975959 RepID=UPI002E0F3B90|nr:CHAT domain-containing protein [Dactylosporangium sp. NBC_01737]